LTHQDIQEARINRDTAGIRCPNLECGAQNVALTKDHAPAERPLYVDCETPFMAEDKGHFLHYQPLRFD
jgi:hypothetical protein